MTKEEKEKIFGKDYHEINDKKIVSRMIMSDTFPEQWTFLKKNVLKMNCMNMKIIIIFHLF